MMDGSRYDATGQPSHEDEPGEEPFDDAMDGEYLDDEEFNEETFDDAATESRPAIIPDWPLHLEAAEFDQLVTEVMDELPQEWAPLLDNMAVVVEEEPTADDLAAHSAHDDARFGHYRGERVPLRLLGGGLTGPAVAAPPEIALFQFPLERASATLEELRQNVYDTLVQEIGHVFGYRDDEDELDDDEDEEFEDNEEDDEYEDEEDGEEYEDEEDGEEYANEDKS